MVYLKQRAIARQAETMLQQIRAIECTRLGLAKLQVNLNDISIRFDNIERVECIIYMRARTLMRVLHDL